MKRLKHILIVTLRITVITIVVSFISVELLMRYLTTTRLDGTVSYRGMIISPLVIPVDDVEADVERYLTNEDEAIFRYDAQLGWRFPENFANDLMTTNDIGLRSLTNYSLENPDDVIRIAIFGDSFVAGGEVADTDAIPPLLEETLATCGVSAEVMNFGVFGYGMDQSYLLWQSLGQEYDPDIVIMGFQVENLNRNVNMARPLVAPSSVPFTKPRYILDGDRPELINMPTVPLQELVGLYQSFEDWEFASYEWHYDDRYTNRWVDISILYRVIEARQNIELVSRLRLSPDDERVQLGYHIIEQFANNVLSDDREFVILHLPNHPELRPYIARGSFGYQFMIDELSDAYHFIHTENVFTSINGEDWRPNLHYSSQTNQRVATLTADWLVENINGIRCQSP